MPHAFVTLMTTDSWVIAVEALAYSLRPSAAHLRVLVIPDVAEHSREKLRQAGCEVVEVAPIASPFSTDVGAWVSSAMTKLRVWEQTDWTRSCISMRIASRSHRLTS